RRVHRVGQGGLDGGAIELDVEGLLVDLVGAHRVGDRVRADRNIGGLRDDGAVQWLRGPARAGQSADDAEGDDDDKDHRKLPVSHRFSVAASEAQALQLFGVALPILGDLDVQVQVDGGAQQRL